jgi:hypothetical protein
LSSVFVLIKIRLLPTGETRASENNEFKTTVADQRTTKALLEKAVGVLQAYYEQKKGALFLQQVGHR